MARFRRDVQKNKTIKLKPKRNRQDERPVKSRSSSSIIKNEDDERKEEEDLLDDEDD